MLHGKVLRPPSFGATLLSVDSQQAEKMGATVVRDGNFVGVAAASSKQAADAVAAVHASGSPSRSLRAKSCSTICARTPCREKICPAMATASM